MRWVALISLLAAGFLTGCGESGSEPASTAQAESIDSDAEIAEADTKYDVPPITRTLAEEWPERWCEVRIGMTREQAVKAMGSYPTDQDSGKIPLIPSVGVGSPPEPAGSDTWEAPGSYQFNAFFDLDLLVQQLDYSGPPRDLPCAAIRVNS